MRKLTCFALLLCFGAIANAAQGEDESEGNILMFKTMASVSGPFVGTANPIRGIVGGGLPWTISAGKGELKADGRLVVHVSGLVLADAPAVPANLRLTNPVPNFQAIVSCMTIDSMGNPAVANISTAAFPATPQGDSKIDATLTLPSVCFAPIIFVTSPTGAWFAATGFQTK
jgi:hypothetical protein